MSNMGYCRFQNTLGDMQDCVEYFRDKDLSPEEKAARDEMLELCREIVADFGDDNDEDDNE